MSSCSFNTDILDSGEAASSKQETAETIDNSGYSKLGVQDFQENQRGDNNLLAFNDASASLSILQKLEI
jgi:hypothetical protein